MKFRKKPIVVEASRWFQNGDHPNDESEVMRDELGHEFKSEGTGVRRFRTPEVPGSQKCEHCGEIMHVHGWIDTLEGGHIVCSGDWIVTGIQGERYPVKNDIFLATYEKVND